MIPWRSSGSHKFFVGASFFRLHCSIYPTFLVFRTLGPLCHFQNGTKFIKKSIPNFDVPRSPLYSSTRQLDVSYIHWVTILVSFYPITCPSTGHARSLILPFFEGSFYKKRLKKVKCSCLKFMLAMVVDPRLLLYLWIFSTVMVRV